jgi:hypothetical protein
MTLGEIEIGDATVDGDKLLGCEIASNRRSDSISMTLLARLVGLSERNPTFPHSRRPCGRNNRSGRRCHRRDGPVRQLGGLCTRSAARHRGPSTANMFGGGSALLGSGAPAQKSIISVVRERVFVPRARPWR